MHIFLDPGPDRHAQPTTRFRRPAEIAEGGERVGKEHDPEARGDEVEAAGREFVYLRVGKQRRQVGDPAVGDALAQQAEHRLGDVDPGDMATGPDRRGERQCRRTGAAADIEHPLAGAGARLPEDEFGDLDIARLLHFGALHPARPGDLVPVAPHIGVGSIRGWARLAHRLALASLRVAG